MVAEPANYHNIEQRNIPRNQSLSHCRGRRRQSNAVAPAPDVLGHMQCCTESARGLPSPVPARSPAGTTTARVADLAAAKGVLQCQRPQPVACRCYDCHCSGHDPVPPSTCSHCAKPSKALGMLHVCCRRSHDTGSAEEYTAATRRWRFSASSFQTNGGIKGPPLSHTGREEQQPLITQTQHKARRPTGRKQGEPCLQTRAESSSPLITTQKPLRKCGVSNAPHGARGGGVLKYVYAQSAHKENIGRRGRPAGARGPRGVTMSST